MERKCVWCIYEKECSCYNSLDLDQLRFIKDTMIPFLKERKVSKIQLYMNIHYLL